MKRIVPAINIKWNLIVQPLMGPIVVVFHLPQLELITAIFRIPKTKSMENLLFIGSITALNEPIPPGFTRWNQGMNPTIRFYCFGESSLSVRMRRVSHRKAHGVIGERDKKGGKTSIDRLKTAAIVSL
jgi:hypothetical protein